MEREFLSQILARIGGIFGILKLMGKEIYSLSKKGSYVREFGKQAP
jgi:hypothetical protein